ncbi:MAG: hypothetical protein HFACDABA_01928 [Anaerolineales bacterium]|nr:hypothetical protein [Anaerolineales bacterium]
MDASPRTHRFLPADILTSSYRIAGKVMVSTNGVMGVMNDPTHSFMEVHDARMARIHMPSKLVDHFEVVRMLKRQVFAVALARREDLGPQMIVRGGYGLVTEYPIRLTTQVYEIEGKIETPGKRFDFSSLMAEGSRDFVPIFDAVLTAILIPNLRVESPGMLFNRSLVDLLALQAQRVKLQQ